MNDVTIIDLLWERDESAIKMAEEKYHVFCYSIARKILVNREDAEECVNDTRYAAWKYIPPQRPPKLAAFLGKITRGLAIDRLRKKYAAKRADLYITDIAEEAENLNAVVHDLDERMEAAELLAIINRFLGEIPEREGIFGWDVMMETAPETVKKELDIPIVWEDKTLILKDMTLNDLYCKIKAVDFTWNDDVKSELT